MLFHVLKHTMKKVTSVQDSHTFKGFLSSISRFPGTEVDLVCGTFWRAQHYPFCHLSGYVCLRTKTALC